MTARFRYPGLICPATLSQRGDALVLANSQFNHHDNHAEPAPQGLLSIPLARINAGK